MWGREQITHWIQKTIVCGEEIIIDNVLYYADRVGNYEYPTLVVNL